MDIRGMLGEASFEQHDWAEPDLLLMADEDLVEQADGAELRLCQMEKAPSPVLTPTQIWEGGDGQKQQPLQQDPISGDVLYDGHSRRFHCWYRTHNRLLGDSTDPALGDDHSIRSFKTQGSVVCYATSEDGLHWEKPALGAVKFDGSYENNMVKVSVGPILSDHLSGVTPNYVEDAQSKLVGTVYSAYHHPIYSKGITQIYSDDGIDWTAHWPPTLPLDGDAHCLMWNAREKCYLCTTRSHAYAHTLSRLRQRGYDELTGKRQISLARSTDLVHWTPMVPVLEADEEDGDNAQLYYMYIVPYGHLYLGFVQLFYIGRRWTYGPLEMQLAVSRDLMNWHRAGSRVPILPRGEKGSWDQSHVSLCTSMPHPEGDRMRFWYGGKDTEHWQAGNAAMGTATLRRDGFACWEAGSAGGTVTTRPMQMRWASWPMMNVDASKGEVRLELLDVDDKPIDGCSAADCLPITGDHIRKVVEYKEGRGTFVRHTGPVKLRIHLKNAKLYAIKMPNVTF